MINVIELKVGNWIWAKGEKVLVEDIHIISGGHAVFHLPNSIPSGQGAMVTLLSECEPIPLTTEILEHCRLNKYRYWWSHPKHNTFSFEEWSHNGLGLYLHVGNLKVGKYIRYLHQLQNLYFELTGVELEISFMK